VSGYGCGAEPATINVSLLDVSPARSLAYAVLSYDIAPDAPDDSGDYRYIWINMQHCVNVTVYVQVGYAALSGLPGGIAQTGPGDCATAFSIGVYNGNFGQNPRGFTVQVLITPAGVPSGYIIVGTNVPGYGTATCQINLSGGLGATIVRDSFHGIDHSSIANHTPDLAPDAAYAGEVVGWHGRAAYADEILSNTMSTGGSDGTVNYGRIWSSRNDHLKIYRDMTREAFPGGGGEVMAILGRASRLDGNTDTGVDLIWFFTQSFDDNTVLLSWDQRYSDGSGWHIVQGDYQFQSFAWTRGTAKRLGMVFIGDKLYLYIADTVTGDNAQLIRTVTLATPWNDTSHQYVGFADTHYPGNVVTTEFFGGALTTVGQPASPPWQSFTYITKTGSVPWLSETWAVEARVPWSSGRQVLGKPILFIHDVTHKGFRPAWVNVPPLGATAEVWVRSAAGGSWELKETVAIDAAQLFQAGSRINLK
jgi:hypothetical protein